MATDGEATCPYCAETIKADAVKCRYCGEFLDFYAMAKSAGKVPVRISAYNPGLSAAMSAVLPGLGQIFQGRLTTGLIIVALFAFFNFLAVNLLITADDGMRNSIIPWLLAAALYVVNVYEAHSYRPPAVGRLEKENV